MTYMRGTLARNTKGELVPFKSRHNRYNNAFLSWMKNSKPAHAKLRRLRRPARPRRAIRELRGKIQHRVAIRLRKIRGRKRLTMANAARKFTGQRTTHRDTGRAMRVHRRKKSWRKG